MDSALQSLVVFDSCYYYVGSFTLQISPWRRGDSQVIFELSSGTEEVTVETKMCICFHLLAILVDCDSECADRKFMLFEWNAYCLMMMDSAPRQYSTHFVELS